MHRRKWDANTTALIVIEGLNGKPVAAICPEHHISQSPYDQWRDQFLAQAANACAVHQQTKKEALLAQENARLKRLVGELTLEFNKSDALLGCNDGDRFRSPSAMKSDFRAFKRSKPSPHAGATAASGPLGVLSSPRRSTRSGACG
jgi:hypothetical protein